MGQNSQEYRLKYWATRSSVPSFAHSLTRGTVNDWMAIYSVFSSILAHSALSEPSAPSLTSDESVVPRNSFLHDVIPAIEGSTFSWRRGQEDGSVGAVFDRGAAFVD